MGDGTAGNEQSSARVVAGRKTRHGRGNRSIVSGPIHSGVHSRINQFTNIAAGTLAALQQLWPTKLADLQLDVVTMLDGQETPQSIEASFSKKPQHWRIYPEERRIVLFRAPIEQSKSRRVNTEHGRELKVELAVYGAVSDYLDIELWELSAGEQAGQQ